MRRARIKVQATVPVRRKIAQTPTLTKSEKPPSISNSISDGEKTTTVTDINLEKTENAPKNVTETESLSISAVKLHEEPIISLPTPTFSSENETQNAIQEERNANIEQNREEICTISIKKEVNVNHHLETEVVKVSIKKEVNVNHHLETEIVKVTKKAVDPVINKELTNSVTNKETVDSVTCKELNNIDVNKETINVEVLGGNKDVDNLNVMNQAEKEIPETLIPHVDIVDGKKILSNLFFCII